MPPPNSAALAVARLTDMQWQLPLTRLFWVLRRLPSHAIPPPARLALAALGRLARQPAVKQWARRVHGYARSLAARYGIALPRFDAAAAMANVDLGGQYKRIMRFFWDPEPHNEDTAPIWCLGREYASKAAPAPPLLTQSHHDLHQEDADRDTVMVSSRHSEPVRRPSSGSPSLEETGGSGVLVPKQQDSRDQPHQDEDEERGWPQEFLDDFESRFWFTYRSHFPAIEKSADPASSSSLSLGVRLRSQLVDKGGFTSDTGWGCMIRSGQSVLANSLALLRLGRDWRCGQREDAERQLVSLFADDPRAPFSLHRFVEHGASHCGKYPGEWFGPSATARCIQALTASHCPTELKVYITGDGADVYEDTFRSLAHSQLVSTPSASEPSISPPSDTAQAAAQFTPVLLLVGTRLGIDRINPVYLPALEALLRLPQSVGIAGGRPSASHYFVGAQGASLFYLDPHQTRPALAYHAAPESYSADEVASCHTRRLRRLGAEDMDPSMLIAFLIRDESDWAAWKEAVGRSEGGRRIVHVAPKEPPRPGEEGGREGAIAEVESFDDEAEADDEIVHV